MESEGDDRKKSWFSYLVVPRECSSGNIQKVMEEASGLGIPLGKSWARWRWIHLMKMRRHKVLRAAELQEGTGEQGWLGRGHGEVSGKVIGEHTTHALHHGTWNNQGSEAGTAEFSLAA